MIRPSCIGKIVLIVSLFCLVPMDLNPARAQGFLPETEMSMRGIPIAPRFRSYLPIEVDLSKRFPPPGYQGLQGSCTAWATGYAMRSYYQMSYVEDKKHVQTFSPAFLYNQLIPSSEKQSCSEGVRISDALKMLQKNGVVPLESFPYDRYSCSLRPSTELLALAQNYKIDEWHRLSTNEEDDLKGELAMGHPVVFGMYLPSRFKKLKKGQIFHDPNQPDEVNDLAHAMVLVGYSDDKQAFKLMNSWGTVWADDGFAWLTYETFKRRVMAAFSMRVPVEVAKVKKVNLTPPALPKLNPVLKPRPVQKKKLEELKALPNFEEKLQELITQTQCSSLSYKKGIVSGYVAEMRDLERLDILIGQHANVRKNIVIRPWPQCEVLQTFKGVLTKRNTLGVRAETLEGKRRRAFQEDEYMVLTIAPPPFEGYLYATYIQASGDVVHLLRGKRSEKGKVLLFGADDKKPRLRVSAPFGREAIFVLATEQPLFEESYPTLEQERTFLTRFRKALLKQKRNAPLKERLAAIYFLETKPKNDKGDIQ